MDVSNIVLTPENLRFVPPTLPEEAILRILEKQYGLIGTLKPLAGERDQNYRLSTEDGAHLVVKVSSLDEDPAVIDFQVSALLHLEKKDPSLPAPRLLRTETGDALSHVLDDKGRPYPLRLLTYISGIPFGESSPSPNSLEKIGAFQGRLSLALSDFQHNAARHFMPWDISNGLVFNKALFESAPADIQGLVSRFLPYLKQVTFPALPSLRRQVIHNDCHGGNLLRASEQSEKLVGVIDFGDMIEAPLIQDIAVSMASFIVTQPDQLKAIEALAKGFHSVFPFKGTELDLLYDLVILRLLVTLLLIDYRLQISAAPDEELAAENQLIKKALGKFGDLDRATVATCLRETCQMRAQ